MYQEKVRHDRMALQKSANGTVWIKRSIVNDRINIYLQSTCTILEAISVYSFTRMLAN
jgi:hypothetical protein